MNRYRVTLKLDDEKTNVMVYAHNSDIARNIVTTMMHCALNEILEVLEVDGTIHCSLRELEFKQFKDTVANMKYLSSYPKEDISHKSIKAKTIMTVRHIKSINCLKCFNHNVTLGEKFLPKPLI